MSRCCMSRSRPFQKNTAFGRFRVFVQELHVVTGIYFQALFSELFGQNVGATWLYTHTQFYTTKQIIDKVEQDSLCHFDYKISESDLYFFTQNKPIKVVDFDRYSTNLNHRSQMT